MTLLAHGTAEQICAHVPALVTRRSAGGLGVHRAWDRVRPRQIATRAERIDGGWRLNGQKLLISFAGAGGQALVFARTGERSLGAFLVDTASPDGP